MPQGWFQQCKKLRLWGLTCAGALALAGAAHAQSTPAQLPSSVTPPTATAPATPAPAAEAPAVLDSALPPLEACTPGCAEPKDKFANMPPITPMPRVGFFFVWPQGPGYYSLRDFLTDKYRESRPPEPYGPVGPIFFPFFDADFRYLDKPGAERQSPFDALKRMRIGDNFMLSIGGEERLRFINEVDSRLSGRDNNYQLLRSRVYADLSISDWARAYVEFIDSRIYNNDLGPLATDVKHGDLLNAFVDLKVLELADAPVWVRTGRQELLFGSQRLVSPLDWSNTRRTFEGVRGFRHSEDFDVDLFWTQPVIQNPTRFNSVDDRQNFSGAWATYRPQKGQTLDLYYLDLDNSNHVAAGQGGRLGAYNTSTFGTRYAGNFDKVLFDFEGMYQFGPWSNQSTSAAAYTTSLGYNFADVPFNPQFWIGYDFASGNHNPGTTDTHGTFNQLFPFGHYYNFLDLVGRQNIEDLHMQFTFFPTKWITSCVQYHIYRLDSAKDALYNSAGAPIRVSPTGKAGTDVGDELDLTTNFRLTPRQDVLVGYSKLFAGSFIKNTGSPRSPEYFYVQYSFKW